MADDWIGIDESTTIDKKVDAETVIFGTTTVYRERMQIAGATTGAIAPVSSAGGLTVDLGTNNDVVISGNSTAIVSTASAIRVKSTGAITVTGTSNVSGSTVILTTGSKVQVEPVAGTTFVVTGTSNVVISGNSTAIVSTVSAIRIKSTAAITIQGNSTAIFSTASKIQVEPAAGTTFTVTGTSNVSGSTVVISGQSTAIQGAGLSSAASSLAWYMRLVDYDSTVGAQVNSSGEQLVTGAVTISGNSTVALAANSTLAATISGNSTAIMSTVSAVRIKSTAAITVTGTSNVSGSTVVMTTASKVLADISTALPAGTNNIGVIRTQKDVNTPVAGTTALTISRATISFATSGAQTVVSSVAGANIRILGWNLVTATTNVLTWFSATTAGTTLAGPYHFAANGGISVPISEYGWMQTTAVGVGIVLKAEVASSVGGNVVYIQSSAI